MPKVTKDSEKAQRVLDDQSLELHLEKPDIYEEERIGFIENNETIYSKILDSYSKNIAFSIWIKLLLKVFFFVIIIYILLKVLGFFSASLEYVFKIITVDNISQLSIESVLSAATIIVPPICSLIVAFIKLPEIIAQYLFNINEDNSMNDIIKNIQVHDRKVYKLQYQKAASKLLKMQNSGSNDEEKEFRENNKRRKKEK